MSNNQVIPNTVSSLAEYHESNKSKLNVLVADRSKTTRKYIIDVLNKNNMNVKCADDGEAALHLIEENLFDI